MKTGNDIKKASIVLLLLSLFIVAGSYGQDSGPKTLFWEISGNGLEKTSYLFGTIHILPKSEFEPFEVADEKLENSELFVLEMEIDVPLKQQMEWAKKMMLPEGELISDYMEEEDFSKLKSYAVDSLKVKDFLFNTYIKMKPFAFYSALIPHAIGKKIEGYEMHFSKIVKKKEIPVHGLETFEFQMAIFDSIPNERQLNMFFEEIPDLKKEMEEMIAIYEDQDIYQMANSLQEEGGEYAELEEDLLIRRNLDWAEKLDQLVKEQSCFIAVGAAHLAGEHGLIKLLREKGYSVEGLMLQ
jgi:uncharacterized protein YbaP (TraB family)